MPHGCIDAAVATRSAGTHHLLGMAKDTHMDGGEAQRRQRVCLSCHGFFDSSWVGERICPRCKGSSTWRSGALKT